MRAVTAIATKPDMTPMNLFITITVTTLDKTAATTTHPFPWMWSATTASLCNDTDIALHHPSRSSFILIFNTLPVRLHADRFATRHPAFENQPGG